MHTALMIVWFALMVASPCLIAIYSDGGEEQAG